MAKKRPKNPKNPKSDSPPRRRGTSAPDAAKNKRKTNPPGPRERRCPPERADQAKQNRGADGTPHAVDPKQTAHGGRPTATPAADAARRHAAAMADRSRANYAAKAEIGEIPPVKDPERKERGRLNLEYYLAGSGYFPNSTGRSPFSPDHQRVLARFQQSIFRGELDWAIVFRGFAKTTLAVGAVSWGAAYGHIHFVPMFGATKELGVNLVDLLKAEWETNDLLYEDFPEICHPIRALEGKHQRCASQTYLGELTNIDWRANRLVLPTIPGSAASGFCAVGLGLTASVRGMVRAMPDGTRQRPDWFVIDDPQTDSSAVSPTQVAKRLNTIRKAILKLGGNQSTIGGVIAGTIIEPDDVMDQLRDHDKFPQFQGEVVKMVSAWSTAHESFWLGDYRRVLTSYDPATPGDFDRAKRDATALYADNRALADAGCVVAWDHCYDRDWELSAIQHAYNLLILDGEDVFAAECQSAPVRISAESEQLTANDVVWKLSGYKHREVPAGAVKLVCVCDVQHESLWYVVVAFTAEFTGHVIDYGVWPEQPRMDGVSKKTIKKTLTKKYAEQRDPAVRIRLGLNDLGRELLDRDWLDADQRAYRICTFWPDQKEGLFSKAIRSWAKTCPWSSIVRPFGGLGLGPADEPLNSRRKKDNEVRRGLYWIEAKDAAVRGGTIISIDKNWWSSFTVNRWKAGSPRPKNDTAVRLSEPGALYLWGTDPRAHATFGQHQTSECSTPLSNDRTGRSVQVWKLRPGRDNEWWDAVVAACAAADYAGGISLKDAGLHTAPSRKRKKLSAAELRALKEARTA